MKISEHVTARIGDIPEGERTLDILRERWRLAALEWSAAEDDASRREEGRKILLDSMVLELRDADAKLSESRAERVARTSTRFKTYIATMHNARRKAQDMRIAMVDADRRYYEQINVEANERSERRLTGMSR